MTTSHSTNIDTPKLSRCGFCGRYFIGEQFLDAEDLKIHNDKYLGAVELGYCPDAQAEYAEQETEQYVTKDMAIDAGMPELEGRRI